MSGKRQFSAFNAFDFNERSLSFTNRKLKMYLQSFNLIAYILPYYEYLVIDKNN